VRSATSLRLVGHWKLVFLESKGYFGWYTVSTSLSGGDAVAFFLQDFSSSLERFTVLYSTNKS
jgi:hypothetical protein